MGALDNPALIRAARFLERFLYKLADGVTAVTDSFCRHIEALMRSEKPLARVMNGTVPEVFQQEEAGRRLRSELDLDDAFVVAYAGNHGEAQGLAHVLGAAARFQKGASGVHFLMVGSGPVKGKLIEKAQQQGLTNVQFRPRVPLKEAGAHMAAADALLVPLARHEIYQQFIPSKLFDSMAAGRPVLLSVSGEARTILEEAGGGRYYPAEDGPALAEQILWLRDHLEARREMGRRGQDYALRHCTREAQAEKLVRFLEDRVADDRSA
jgi:glycosyltransferase involved in cell wall biosynthesis